MMMKNALIFNTPSIKLNRLKKLEQMPNIFFGSYFFNETRPIKKITTKKILFTQQSTITGYT